MARSITIESGSPRDLLDVQDVIRITGFGRTKVFELLTSGELKSFKLGEGRTCKRYILRSDLNAFIRAQAERGVLAVRPDRGRRAVPASPQRRARQSRRTDAPAA